MQTTIALLVVCTFNAANASFLDDIMDKVGDVAKDILEKEKDGLIGIAEGLVMD